jgi:5-methylcytosine-specific restriction enzyme subunit McrC
LTTLSFRDLSPYEGELTAEDDKWLTQVAAIDPRDYRVGIEEDRPYEEEWLPLVERGPDGRWRAGRFIGSLSLAGRRLTVHPRLGIDVVEAWLDQAFGLVAPPASARRTETETFIVRLLARLWCRAVGNATRHGLPLLRLPQPHEGLFVRGRLETRRTLRLISEGRPQVASVTYDRSLAHPLTRVLVCAERALAEQLTATAEWRTERVRQVLPPLRAAVGSRPRLPTAYELSRVRYTPITLPFKSAALLSHRIASRLGYGASDDEGAAEGILVDVAELWELFVLNCARRAAPPGMRVEHGTTAGRRDYLLHSKQGERGMGRLKPDVLVWRGDQAVAVIDAKYKRLAFSRERPTGVDRADLYQLAAYASRFEPEGVAVLVYPRDGDDGALASAEVLGPWRGSPHTFVFERLPTDVAECRKAIAALIADRHPVSSVPAAV